MKWFLLTVLLNEGERSSPARGTWIEIFSGCNYHIINTVVPRTGDVD